MEAPWLEFKQIVDNRNLSIQYISLNNNYYLQIIDGNFHLECILPIGVDNSETNDFEVNYKSLGNKTPKSEVITQFEKEDKILKLASSEISVVNGTGTIVIKIPGTPGSGEGRFIDWGKAWFDLQHHGDKIDKVEVVDLDNLLGYGPGTVLKTYHDEFVLSIERGWRIPKIEGAVQVDSLGGYGFIPSGLYLRIIGIKGESQQSGTLYINLKWGKTE